MPIIYIIGLRRKAFQDKYCVLRYLRLAAKITPIAKCYGRGVHVITQKRIWEAIGQWPHAATALEAWYRLIKASSPKDFAQMKRLFPATDKVGQHHVFDIGGNKLRLIAIVHYQANKVYIQHILSHVEYDKGKWRE